MERKRTWAQKNVRRMTTFEKEIAQHSSEALRATLESKIKAQISPDQKASLNKNKTKAKNLNHIAESLAKARELQEDPEQLLAHTVEQAINSEMDKQFLSNDPQVYKIVENMTELKNEVLRNK